MVTKDVPAYALIIGNPGRQKGWMSEFGEKFEFDESGKAICVVSGQEYVLKTNKLKEL